MIKHLFFIMISLTFHLRLIFNILIYLSVIFACSTDFRFVLADFRNLFLPRSEIVVIYFTEKAEKAEKAQGRPCDGTSPVTGRALSRELCRNTHMDF